MDTTTKLDKFTASPFRQEIELQQIDHEADFTSLRVRIREKSRFTVFDIDAATAAHWGKAMTEWAASRPAQPPARGQTPASLPDNEGEGK